MTGSGPSQNPSSPGASTRAGTVAGYSGVIDLTPPDQPETCWTLSVATRDDGNRTLTDPWADLREVGLRKHDR